MSLCKMTLIGMYNFDEALFENMQLPSGIDKDLVVNSILMKCGEMEPLYASLSFFKLSIGVWSEKWRRTFEKWYNALQIEYDPLYNYDRHEEYSDTITSEKENSETRTGSTNDTGSNSNSASDSSENAHTKSAYDSATYVPYEKNNLSGSSTVNGQFRNDGQFLNNDSGSASESSEHEHTAHLYGNIGVTTSQQMLEAELDISRWNLVEHITDTFMTELMIMTY